MKKMIIFFALCLIQNIYSMDDEDYQKLEILLSKGPLSLMHHEDNELVDFDNGINNYVLHENVQQYNNEDSLSKLPESSFDFEQLFNKLNVNYTGFQDRQPGQHINVENHFVGPIRTHTGEKPHVCKYEGCEKAFGRKFTLVKHYKTHKKLN